MNKQEVLQRTARYLMLHSSFTDKIGLFEGKMGIILFFMNYSRYTRCKRYEKFAGELIDEIYAEIHIDCSPDFGNGLAGIAWGMEYLIRNHFVKADPDKVLIELDNRILERDVRRVKDFSVENGLKGIATYVISRCAGRKYSCIFEEYIFDLAQALQASTPDDKESFRLAGILQDIINKNETSNETYFLDRFIAKIQIKDPLNFIIGRNLGIRGGHAGIGLKMMQEESV